MLDRFPADTLRPGDVIVTNDPWMGTGHLYDINVMAPVFRRGRLCGYSMSITHLPDIGGRGFSATARSIYEEGLRLPVSRLVSAGAPNRELLDLIRTNVRVPDHVVGDLNANVTCNAVAGRLLLEFMEEYDIEDLVPLSRQILELSERAMRDRIRDIPDGRYDHRIQIEGEDAPIALACSVTIEGERVQIDFSGTDPAIDFGINVPLCYTRAFAAYAVKCLTTPMIPNNEGSFAPITVSAPAGASSTPSRPSRRGSPHRRPLRDPARHGRPRPGGRPRRARGRRHAEPHELPGAPSERARRIEHLLRVRRLRGPRESRRRGLHAVPVQHDLDADRDLGGADRHHHRAEGAARRFGRGGAEPRRRRPGARHQERQRASDDRLVPRRRTEFEPLGLRGASRASDASIG